MLLVSPVELKKIDLELLGIKTTVQLYILREDLNHPYISGNKFRKLKYNIAEAKRLKKQILLTFGGAYSNHISAVAFAAKEYNFKSIGYIRGEELDSEIESNPTLKFAKSCGMNFEFIDRATYRKKEDKHFIHELNQKYPQAYIIPEGGTNELAIKGCQEIITENLKPFDYICCSVGTGGTMIGLLNGKFDNQKILGFLSLKGSSWLYETIHKFTNKTEYELFNEYHFGGYAKINDDLINFVNGFKSKFDIQLDPIYTGKMLFGIIDLIRKKNFKANSKILAIHTGGLQGINGINQRLNKQNKQLITV